MDFKTRYQYNPKTDILGKGGFATVYKAHDVLLDRMVALKFFQTGNDKHTLILEIRRAISLEHINICRYYDAAQQENTNFHGEIEKMEIGVMEYLDGGDLKNHVRQYPEQLNKLLVDVLRGLSYLHKNSIIHRDLKPQNILIKNTSEGPIAKITDFGISKDAGSDHTSSSQLMGTIEYMAPEQFSPAKYGINGRIGTNLDLWSFGLMVYELVIGESLFGSRGGQSSAEQIMGNILNDDLIEEKINGLPEPYKTLVSRCLVKDAKQRVQSAEELILLLPNGKIEQQNFSTSTNLETRIIESKFEETKAIPPTKLINEQTTDLKIGKSTIWNLKNYYLLQAIILSFNFFMILSLIYRDIEVLDIIQDFNKFERIRDTLVEITIILLPFTIFYWQTFLKKKWIWILCLIINAIIIILLTFEIIDFLFESGLDNRFKHLVDFLYYLMLLATFIPIVKFNPVKLGFQSSSKKQIKYATIGFVIFFMIIFPIEPIAILTYTNKHKNSTNNQPKNDSVTTKLKSGDPYFYYNDFSNKSSWQENSDTIAVNKITNGELIYTSFNVDVKNSINTPIDLDKNFECSLTVKWIKGFDKSPFGIDFCADNQNNSSFIFAITSKGNFGIVYINSGKANYFAPFTNSSYINEATKENSLSVKKVGKEINFYINDHKVYKMLQSKNYGNGFGIWISRRQTVAFDDLKITGVVK